jgi:hypothetical protein
MSFSKPEEIYIRRDISRAPTSSALRQALGKKAGLRATEG